MLRAFELGITDFGLANHCGPPPGTAEENFGRRPRADLAAHRDERIRSPSAGYTVWPGPSGETGGSRKYRLAALDPSPRRLGLAHTVRSGKARYVGRSNDNAEHTARAARILRELGAPCSIPLPKYALVRTLDQTRLHPGPRRIRHRLHSVLSVPSARPRPPHEPLPGGPPRRCPRR